MEIVYVIDADVLCLGSLSELWKMDCDFINLSESHIGGEKQAKAHGHEKYGLSGEMVMNLKELRDFDFIEKAFKPFEIDLPLWCHEESIINHYFYDRLTFIDRKYNYCYNRIYREPVENIVLLHFPSLEKRYMRLEYT